MVESVDNLRFYCINKIKQITYLCIFKLENRISGGIVNVFIPSVVDNVFEPSSDQTKDDIIGIFLFHTKHGLLRGNVRAKVVGLECG